MVNQRKHRHRWLICVCNDDYPASLELRKVYRRLPDRQAEADGWVRVVDESEEDYLYPADFFRPILVTPALERHFFSRKRSRIRQMSVSRGRK